MYLLAVGFSYLDVFCLLLFNGIVDCTIPNQRPINAMVGQSRLSMV